MQNLQIALWNVEWAKPGSSRAQAIRGSLRASDPDIVCLTECYSDMLGDGHQAESKEDYGYAVKKERRKVLLVCPQESGPP